MSDRYEIPSCADFNIIDGRYYLALREPRILVRVQPLIGFPNTAGAESYLSGLLTWLDEDRRDNYIIVEAAQIETAQFINQGGRTMA